MNDQRERLAFAIEAADAAGALAMRYFQGSELGAELKKDRTVVTKADREAEALIRAMLEKKFPKDGIVGEEHGVKQGTSGWIWYLDPIDGTQAFARGVPLFGTLVAAEKDDKPTVGVIGMPAMRELVYASKGDGCWWRKDGEKPARAKVSDCAKLEDAMWCTTWMQGFKDKGQMGLFQSLTDKTAVFRGWGDCYGYALVATGRADIMVDPVLAVWDAAPLLIVVEEAGGKYTSFEGKPDIRAGSGFATNGTLHEAVQRLIAQR